MVDLGEAAPLDDLAQQLTRSVSEPHRDADAVPRAGQALERRLFARIAPLLRPGTRRLLIAPDGALHLAPLHLMHDGQRWLLDRYTVSYLTSGRDLLRERSLLDTPGDPVALAVTRYAVPAWNLRGLTVQADLLPRLIPAIHVLRDDAATEAALSDVNAPRVLHVAAHGQFLDDASPNAARTAMQRGRLVMADADPTLAERFDRSDGYATASELLTTNLRGTRLVVLSACETARGSAAAGQSVFGLRRAFLLAGAEAVVITQWKVDEHAGLVFRPPARRVASRREERSRACDLHPLSYPAWYTRFPRSAPLRGVV